jgi:hypothetical protein
MVGLGIEWSTRWGGQLDGGLRYVPMDALCPTSRGVVAEVESNWVYILIAIRIRNFRSWQVCAFFDSRSL